MGVSRTTPLRDSEVDAAIASTIVRRHAKGGAPLLVGLSGSQGSGKSTRAGKLAALLAEQSLATAVLSLDDFYLTRAEREGLARTVHPLFVTRGVPGTHDMALLGQVLDCLLTSARRDVVHIPRFDKPSDDRLPEVDWRCWQGQADVVLLEGWCVGARAQAAEELAAPCNAHQTGK